MGVNPCRTESSAGRSDPTWKRLYEKVGELEEKKEAMRKAQEEKELAQCTFKPELVRSSSPERSVKALHTHNHVHVAYEGDMTRGWRI